MCSPQCGALQASLVLQFTNGAQVVDFAARVLGQFGRKLGAAKETVSKRAARRRFASFSAQKLGVGDGLACVERNTHARDTRPQSNGCRRHTLGGNSALALLGGPPKGGEPTDGTAAWRTQQGQGSSHSCKVQRAAQWLFFHVCQTAIILRTSTNPAVRFSRPGRDSRGNDDFLFTVSGLPTDRWRSRTAVNTLASSSL